MSKYTCITLGPIVATLEKARKTREIWAASFLFSRIMKGIVGGITQKENIIIPFREEDKVLFHVGLYPDHLIYRHQDKNDCLDIKTIIQNTKEKVLQEIIARERFTVKEGEKVYLYSEGSIREFLEEYLQIYYFTVDLEESSINEGGKEKNFLEEIDEIFNAVELQVKIRQETEFRLADFFRMIPVMPLYKNAEFTGELERCRSLVEIATADFWKLEEYEKLAKQIEPVQASAEKVEPVQASEEKTSENGEKSLEDEDFLSGVRALVGDKFKSYHKYVVVVQSDGDRMGRFNQGYVDFYKRLHPGETTEKAIQKVSETLFAWGEEAAGLIHGYRGLTIYAGGDDLFFFAPVVRNFECDEKEGAAGQEKEEGKEEVYREPETIVDLLESISILFKDKMKKLAAGNDSIELPSLSFGMSVAFYKYPLGESHQQALSLMYQMKREFQGNGVNMTILKHSGSDFRFQLHLQPLRHNEKYSWYSVFKNMMKAEVDQDLLSSVAYHLQEDARVIDEIADSEERIRQFFVHKMEGFPPEKEISELGYRVKDGEKKVHFLLEVEKLVKLAFIGMPAQNQKGEYIDRMLPVYDMLRIVKFFKGLDEKH